MIKALWIFPAIFCLLLSLTFSEGLFMLGAILSIIWLIRIACLKQPKVLLLSLGLGVLFVGVIFYQRQSHVSAFTGEESPVVVYPKMTTLQVDGNSIRFDGELQTENTAEPVVVSYYAESEAEKEEWLHNPPTSHLLIEGELAEPAANTNFYQFNYQNYLKRRNIHWQVEAESVEIIQSDALKKTRFYWLEDIRQAIFQYIDQTFASKIGSYLKILFFADDRDFSEDTLDDFRSLGVIHLFSISGFHITYLVALLRQVLLRLGITHETTNIFLILILPLYGLLAGFGVSIFRAVFQNIIMLAGNFFDDPIDRLDAWSLTMMLALFINPYQVYNISFQLSYTLSAMFILLGKQKWLQTLHPLKSSVLFSLMSSLASVPIITYHFFEIPWVTVITNLLFIPLFTYGLFPLLLILLLVSFILAQTQLFTFLNEGIVLIINMVEQFLNLLTSTFNFSLVTGRLPGIILCVLVISVFIVLKKIEEQKYPSMLATLCIILSLFYHQLSPVGYVTMLDVGQGESLLIKEPYTQKVTLIDTGGRVEWGEQEPWKKRTSPFSIGTDVVVPAVKAFGISEIDRLYLTHAHADHVGEIEAIGQELKIKEVAATSIALTDPAVMKQIATLNETDIVMMDPLEETTYPAANTLVLHPTTENNSKNNHSLVMYVKMGEDTWLFTGDIETEAEAQILSQYPNLTSDYLKVAHHGSQTSSTQSFIEQIKPKVALISAGTNNQFGHPNQEVLDRFDNENIEVYTTSEQGAIQYRYLKIPLIDYWLTDEQTVHKN